MKLSNEENLDLALMLYDEPENPVFNSAFFRSKDMDLSVESLQVLDDYLESVRGVSLSNKDIIKIVMRSGAYLGEVIKNNASIQLDWLDYEEAAKLSSYINDQKIALGIVHVLYSENSGFMFPLAKILKRLENGAEDNIISFAKVALTRNSR